MRSAHAEALEGRQFLSGTLYVTHAGYFTGNFSHVIVEAGPATLDLMHLETWDSAPLIEIQTSQNVSVTRTVGIAHPIWPGAPARFLYDNTWWGSVTISHDVLAGTGGILIGGWQRYISITDNYAENISGARGDGGREFVGFVDLSWCHSAGEIAWNAVHNVRGQSAVEDVINLYDSGGFPGSPLFVHDNLIDGAYAYGPGPYSGGGIMAGDGDNNPANAWTWPGYTHVFSNTVVNSDTYGISVSAGHDIEIDHNLTISWFGQISGNIAFSWTGEPEWNLWVHDEASGWRAGDYWLPTVSASWNLRGTWESPQQAMNDWWARAASMGRLIGHWGY